MSVIRALFIDDTKIDSITDKLRKSLRKNRGLTLRENVLNLNNDKFKTKNQEGIIVLDIRKIKNEVKEKYFDEPFDIVASDYDFKDNQIDGFQLVKWIINDSRNNRNRIRRANFYLYSAEEDKLAVKLDTIKKIKSLIQLRIKGILNRNTLSNDLVKEIEKKEGKFNFLDIILKELDKYSELEFESVYPKFKGKKLEEIADEIDKDLPNGIKFQKNLAELTIAHMIKLNKQEDSND